VALLNLKSLNLKPRLFAQLSNIVKNESFGSPFIIKGPDREFTLDAAMALAHEILLQYSSETSEIKLKKNSHPDFFIFRPEGARSMHSISDIKRLIDDAIMPPFEGKYKVYLITDAEAMLPVHANALLKTLEDKPEHSVILLTATETTHLLPTIVSRCKTISLDEAAKDKKIDAEFEQNVIDLVAHAWTGHIGKSLVRVAKIEKVIEEMGVARLEEFIDIIFAFHRDLTIYHPNSKYKEIIAKMKDVYLPTFEELTQTATKIHLGYQRHVKIKTLVETMALFPLRSS